MCSWHDTYVYLAATGETDKEQIGYYTKCAQLFSSSLQELSVCMLYHNRMLYIHSLTH